MARDKTEEATHEEFLEALDEPHTSGTFLPKLLKSIILANPSEGTETTTERLNSALRALLGKSSLKIKEISNTKTALSRMALEYTKDHVMPRPIFDKKLNKLVTQKRSPPRTVKELAVQANAKVKGAPSPKYLETKFGKDKKSLILTESYASDIPGSFHLQMLRQMKKDLLPLGVIMKIEDDN